MTGRIELPVLDGTPSQVPLHSTSDGTHSRQYVVMRCGRHLQRRVPRFVVMRPRIHNSIKESQHAGSVQAQVLRHDEQGQAFDYTLSATHATLAPASMDSANWEGGVLYCIRRPNRRKKEKAADGRTPSAHRLIGVTISQLIAQHCGAHAGRAAAADGPSLATAVQPFFSWARQDTPVVR